MSSEFYVSLNAFSTRLSVLWGMASWRRHPRPLAVRRRQRGVLDRRPRFGQS